MTITLSGCPVATSVAQARAQHEHGREHVDDERHAAAV